ncbi:MAG: 6-carboxytetrahydropterin synthase [Sedimentisphaerales bacterium]|nr:6-carboxytetrahydropterin synthase [Sedimentisphaerales bacterium]
MYELQVEHRFRARHGIRLPSGELEPLHEHEWRVRACIEGENLDKNGMVMDFHALKALLKKAAQPLMDGASINEVAFFAKGGASTEQMARFFYERLDECLPRQVRLKAVKLWEEPDQAATYRPTTMD